MEFVIVLVIVLLLGPYGLSAWAHLRAARLERSAAEWRRQFDDLKTGMLARDEEITSLRAQILALRGQPAAEDAGFAEDGEEAASVGETPIDAEAMPPEAAEPAAAAVDAPAPAAPRGWRRWTQGGLEHQFGAVLPVWIGGIAIALAGFYRVKYTNETQRGGPQMRVILGGLMGLALLAAASWVVGRRGGARGPPRAPARGGARPGGGYVYG
jgi:uncharacterized membrane protein